MLTVETAKMYKLYGSLMRFIILKDLFRLQMTNISLYSALEDYYSVKDAIDCHNSQMHPYTVRNGVYLLKAGDFFKTIPHYKVTNIVQIQMKYISGYFEK